MRFSLSLALAASLLLVARAATAEKPAEGKAKNSIEGTWEVVSLEHGGQNAPEDQAKQFKIVITADKLTFKMGNDAAHQATYKVDPSKKPPTIDLTPEEGPEKGKVALGIYSLKGDELKICASKPGAERPTEFKSPAGTEIVLIVLKRAKS
jgi:uncharacterized protein (TIGR03067 family)